MRYRLTLVLILLGLPALAAAQEELLWKADSMTSPTLLPAYGGWPTPFNLKPRLTDGLSADARAQAEREAAARAVAETAARQAAQARAEMVARQKASSLAASNAAVEADLSGINLGGVVQGPLGNSIYWNNQWLKEGTQIKVPTQIGGKMAQTLRQLDQSDSLTANVLRQNLQARLTNQASINVRLVRITSITAVFNDGHQDYTIKLRQPAF